jgi:two-component sensor histidine kinase
LALSAKRIDARNSPKIVLRVISRRLTRIRINRHRSHNTLQMPAKVSRLTARAGWTSASRIRFSVLQMRDNAYCSPMNTEILTVDGVRKWTKDRLRSLKDLQKQLVKSEDVDAIVKGLDAEGWKDFRKTARQLKSQSRTPASFKNRLVKQTTRESKRFTRVLEQLSAK